jgi:hypothetical protein
VDRPAHPWSGVARAAAVGLSLALVVPVLAAAAVSPPAPEVDHAVTFDGVDGRATAAGPVIPMTSGSAFTIEAWVFDADTNGGWQHVLSQGQGGTAVYLGTVFGSQEVRAGDRWLNTGVDLPVGRWVHLALAVAAGSDGSQTARLYLDGRLESTTGTFGAPTAAGAPFRLGAQYTSAGAAVNEPWNGRIDTVRVWSVERSAGEIAGSMHAALPGGTPGLVAQYLANEGTGTTVHDTVAAANDLTLAGGVAWVPVATTTSVGTDSVITFPRSAITAAGGWTIPVGYASADLLVIAGGGGGGAWVGGGGGAGGMVEVSEVAVTAGDVLPVTVGAGGRGARKSSSGFVAGADGHASSIGATGATGGGVGASWTDQVAGSGGSGGGGSRSTVPGAAGIAGQGHAGGAAGSDVQPHPAGGGGGAGGEGIGGSGAASGDGGPGRTSSITGAAVTYAGGGGAGSHGVWTDPTTFTSSGSSGAGGSGGGGGGASATATGQIVRGGDGTAGLGGGGGGSGNNCGTTCHTSIGGLGGSGVVIVRLKLAVATQLGIATQPVGGAASGGALTTQPVIRIVDAQQRLFVEDSTTTVTATIVSGGGTLGGTTTVTAVGGVATFTDLTLTAAEGVDQVLRFTSTPALTAVDAQGVRVATTPSPPAPPSQTTSDLTSTSGPADARLPTSVPAGGGGPAGSLMRSAAFAMLVGALVGLRLRGVSGARGARARRHRAAA